MTERTRSEQVSYIEGIMSGITTYAVWSDGKQYVGVMRKPLDEVLRPYKVKIEQLKRLGEVYG